MKRYKYLIAIPVIILLLIITNPGMEAFENYVGSKTCLGLKKTSDFYVCSEYYDGNTYFNGDRYFAILGHFFKMKHGIWILPPVSFKDDSENRHKVSLQRRNKNNDSAYLSYQRYIKRIDTLYSYLFRENLSPKELTKDLAAALRKEYKGLIDTIPDDTLVKRFLRLHPKYKMK